jgi:hypothetical protein
LGAADGIDDNRTFFAGVAGEDTHGLFDAGAGCGYQRLRLRERL